MSKPRKVTRHGVTVIGTAEFYTTLDGHYEIACERTAVTLCEQSHPVRERRGMGYLCPGGQEHFYPTWHCWDTVVGDHVGGGVYDTMDEAMLVLSQELKGE